MGRRFAATLLLTASLGLCVPKPARATDFTIRSMIVGGSYGILGGTVVGLITVPLTGTLRSMFVGSSVGLYLGIAVGIFYATEKDNPQNPLSTKSAELEPMVPGTPPSPDFAGKYDPEAAKPAAVRMSFEVARF